MSDNALKQIEAWLAPILAALLISILAYNWVQMDSRVHALEQIARSSKCVV